MVTKTVSEGNGARLGVRYMIRATGAFVGIISGLMLVSFLFGLVFTSISRTTPLSWITLVAMVVPSGFAIIGLMAGIGMWRWMDRVTVSNFAFIFSFLIARDWYDLLPEHVSRNLSGYLGESHVLAHSPEADFSYRGILSIIAFGVFYFLIKEYLRELFGLDRVPQQPIPKGARGDSGVPEYPRRTPLTEL